MANVGNKANNTMKQAFCVVDPAIPNTENIVQNPISSKQSEEYSTDKELTDAILEHERMRWEQENTQKNIAIIETLLESDLSKNEGLKSAFESLLTEERSNLDELNADMNPSDTDELDSKINDNVSVQSLPIENEGVDGGGVIEQKQRHITRMERMNEILGTQDKMLVSEDNEMSFEMDS